MDIVVCKEGPRTAAATLLSACGWGQHREGQSEKSQNTAFSESLHSQSCGPGNILIVVASVRQEFLLPAIERI